MSNTPTHTQNLTAAAQRVHDAQAAVERIEQAIKELPAPDAAALDRLNAAYRDYEDATAAQAAGDTADVATARHELDAAREAEREARAASEANEATRGGLERRLETAQAEVTESQSARREAEQAWLAAEADKIDRRWAKIVPELAELFIRMTAIRSRLDQKPVSGNLNFELPVLGPISQEALTPEPSPGLTPDSPKPRRSSTAFETGRANFAREDAAREALADEINNLTSPPQLANT